jgi:hypothetical protein
MHSMTSPHETAPQSFMYLLDSSLHEPPLDPDDDDEDEDGDDDDTPGDSPTHAHDPPIAMRHTNPGKIFMIRWNPLAGDVTGLAGQFSLGHKRARAGSVLVVRQCER